MALEAAAGAWLVTLFCMFVCVLAHSCTLCAHCGAICWHMQDAPVEAEAASTSGGAVNASTPAEEEPASNQDGGKSAESQEARKCVLMIYADQFDLINVNL